MTSIKNPLIWIAAPIVVVVVLTLMQGDGDKKTISEKEEISQDSLVVASAGDDGPPPAANSEFYFLVDASASVHVNSGTQSAVARAGSILQSLVSSWSDYSYLEAPTRYRVGVIGERDADFSPICEFTPATATTIFSSTMRNDQGELDDCLTGLSRAQPEPYTDISGTLWAVGQQLGDGTLRHRTVLILSDMIEDLPGGQSSAPPDLTGVCIGVILTIGTNDPALNDLGTLDQRWKEWATKFARWGAKGSKRWLIGGIDPAQLGSFYRECALR